MIKLIITDLDGTFLNNHGDYNRVLFNEIKKIIAEKNVHFALCTGKQSERVEELFGEDASKFWILGDSASRIKHNGEFVFQSLIDNELGLKIIKSIEQAEVESKPIIVACTPHGAILRENSNLDMVEHVKNSYVNLNWVADYSQIQADFIKIAIYDKNKRCSELLPYITHYEEKAYFVVSEPAWLDVANHGVNKGSTVERLQKILGVTPEETMVFGDGMNDIELMSRGKYSYAVSNAIDEIQSLARYKTYSNNEDGVMIAIKAALSMQ